MGTDQELSFWNAESGACKARCAIVDLPPANALPISATSGRWEYFLFQYLRANNIGVFVLRTPTPTLDLWDHVPTSVHNRAIIIRLDRMKQEKPHDIYYISRFQA